MNTIKDIQARMAELQAELDTLTVAESDGWVVVRSAPSGVWLGRLVARIGGEVTLGDARRLYFWDGAATLSQLALDGVSKPESCKFPDAVPHVVVLDVCEIIPATAKAVKSVQAVTPWRV